jgi:hypothetical protein
VGPPGESTLTGLPLRVTGAQSGGPRQHRAVSFTCQMTVIGLGVWHPVLQKGDQFCCSASGSSSSMSSTQQQQQQQQQHIISGAKPH